MNEKLVEDIVYLLHTYYPAHRDSLTDLDWELYTSLTNCVISKGKIEPVYNQELKEKAIEVMKESKFSFPELESRIFLGE